MSSTEINTSENHQFEEPVLKLTLKAINQLSKLYQEQLKLKQAEVGVNDTIYGIRVGVIGGGCSGLSYKIDFSEKKEKDVIQDYQNFQLLIDLKSSIYLKDVMLDFDDGLNGKGLVFKNPFAKNTCGCGDSFSV